MSAVLEKWLHIIRRESSRTAAHESIRSADIPRADERTGA